VSLIKSQIISMLNESNNMNHVLKNQQPGQTQWYVLVSSFMQVAKSLVPDQILKDEFFEHALLVFGNYAKHIPEINAIRYDKFRSIVQNMERLLPSLSPTSSLSRKTHRTVISWR